MTLCLPSNTRARSDCRQKNDRKTISCLLSGKNEDAGIQQVVESGEYMHKVDVSEKYTADGRLSKKMRQADEPAAIISRDRCVCYLHDYRHKHTLSPSADTVAISRQVRRLSGSYIGHHGHVQLVTEISRVSPRENSHSRIPRWNWD